MINPRFYNYIVTIVEANNNNYNNDMFINYILDN